MGVDTIGFDKPLQIARYTTVPGASTTINIIPIWPVAGWGHIRFVLESDVAFTFNVFQKQRAPSGAAASFNRTHNWAIPAGGANRVATLKAALVCGEYLRLQGVFTTAPTRLLVLATLYPRSFSL